MGCDFSKGCPVGLWGGGTPVNLQVGSGSWAGDRDLVDVAALGVVIRRREARSWDRAPGPNDIPGPARAG